MKRLLLTVLACASLCACTKDLENRVDTLEKKVAELESKINGNADAISKLAEAAAKAVTISSVETLSDGYTIHFSDGTNATIKNGTNGKDGVNGKDGTNGKDGVNGKDGHSPVVGVKEDEGVLYWTVDGEFLLNDGQKVPVTGKDGVDGKTPQFKLENGVWKVSFDGQTWETVPVTGTEEPKLIITETDSEYVFTLGETVIKIAKDTALVLKIDSYSQEVLPGKTLTLNYTLTGADSSTHVVAESKDFELIVDEKSCTISTTIPNGFEKGYILVKAVRNSDSRYSAQYISIIRNIFDPKGGVIDVNDNDYIDW